MKYLVLEDLISEKITDDETMLFNPLFGTFATIDELGSKIMDELKKEKNIDEITEQLLAEYDVEKEILMKDIDSFITQLEQDKFIQFIT